MSKQTQTFFLEEWLRNSSNITITNTKAPLPSSARAIIQSWSDLRHALHQQTFHPSHHLQSLQTLLNSQSSLHVADPQANLLISLISSPNISLPSQSLPLFLRLLYIWLRKSSRPSSSLLQSLISTLSLHFFSQFQASTPDFPVVCYGVLLLGAASVIPVLPNTSKRVCLELLCGLLEQQWVAVASCVELAPEVFAGIGYALSCSEVVYFGRILRSLFGIWCKEGVAVTVPVTHGVMILHMTEWVESSFINLQAFEKIKHFCRDICSGYVEFSSSCAPFAVVMAAAGALRAFNKVTWSSGSPKIVFELRNSLEECIEALARDLISRNVDLCNSIEDPSDRLLLQCISLGMARSGLLSFHAPLLRCLVLALLFEIFPLRSFYGNCAGLDLNEVKKHRDSILFKEAGAVTRALCNQYASADDENKGIVENLIWGFCQGIYSGHRRVAILLQTSGKELLAEMEKIAEACFLMVVVFASMVTKHRFDSHFPQETRLEISVRILIAFSCIEYFRRVRLPEYTDAIRAVVVSVQENESSCITFIESMPPYAELMNRHGIICSHLGLLHLEKLDYVWLKDDVQTARILFYLRVIPTCIGRVPAPVFRNLVASTMFLYMGHPNSKVARASHSMFVAFVSSGKASNQEDRDLLKEQLVFYYMQKSLEGYPKVTPFEGMASGVAALVRQLPAGSPAIFYCIHSLIEKANSFCTNAIAENVDIWKNWQGDPEPCKKLLEFLLRLLSLVDIQVLPNLMKLLAQLVVQLPKDGQNLVLDEVHSLVAESDDVTRKPALVSWLQSLSYVCLQSTDGRRSRIEEGSKWSKDPLKFNQVSSRL